MPVTEFPTGVPVYTATIGEILATYSPDQTRADATDAPGCTLEAKGGKWYGDLGTMPKATADALYASGALANLATGATYRDTSGTQYTYGGAGAGWSPSSYGPIYNGTTLPFPVGGDCLRIRVVNPAVPKGWSWLEWSGTIFAPPAGEPIAMIWRKASPVALVTPGNTELTVIYQSPVIPDYMLPANIKAKIHGFMFAKNAAGAANCLLGFAVSGVVPTVTNQYEYAYPLARNVTPSAGGIGIGVTSAPKTLQSALISLTNARTHFLQPYNYGPLEVASTDFIFVAGSNRVYAMAQPSGIGDQIQLDGYSLVSEGNL